MLVKEMKKATAYSRRRGRPAGLRLQRPDYPYTMKMPDGRTLFVEVPGRWTTEDRDGSILFLPQAIRFLDRVRVMAAKLDRAPTPGYLTTLREALGMTQEEFGAQVKVRKMTVSRWERGELRPSKESLAAIKKLRATQVAKGVVLPG